MTDREDLRELTEDGRRVLREVWHYRNRLAENEHGGFGDLIRRLSEFFEGLHCWGVEVIGVVELRAGLDRDANWPVAPPFDVSDLLEPDGAREAGK